VIVAASGVPLPCCHIPGLPELRSKGIAKEPATSTDTIHEMASSLADGRSSPGSPLTLSRVGSRDVPLRRLAHEPILGGKAAAGGDSDAQSGSEKLFATRGTCIVNLNKAATALAAHRPRLTALSNALQHAKHRNRLCE